MGISGKILVQPKTWKNWHKKNLAFLCLPTIKPTGHNPFLGKHGVISHPWKVSQYEGGGELICCSTSESIKQLGWVPSLHWSHFKDYNAFVYIVFPGTNTIISGAWLPRVEITTFSLTQRWIWPCYQVPVNKIVLKQKLHTSHSRRWEAQLIYHSRQSTSVLVGRLRVLEVVTLLLSQLSGSTLGSQNVANQFQN